MKFAWGILAALLSRDAAASNLRELAGIDTLNIIGKDLLESVPAQKLDDGFTQMLDDAFYKTGTKKGKIPTTTTTTTSTTTMTTTTTRGDVLITPGDSTQMCSEICALAGSTCYEGGQIRINSDIGECVGQLVASGVANVVATSQFSYPNFFPTGCFTGITVNGFIGAGVSTNDQGSGELGCNAPVADRPPVGVQRLCSCFVP